jgi:predicted Fe-Mo cluster-binding NifX family protein
VTLHFDQAEAIRLADLEGLYQEAAALRMGVSRQTFGRIVESARRVVADAIINGKCLHIDGGEVIVEDKGGRTMKIAVPARDGLVDAHFGHCEYFMVYSLDEKKKIVAEEKINSQEGCGCKSNIAGILVRTGVTHMVAGNMGEGAVHVLQAHGIDVIRGASGNARQAAEQFAAGTLADSRESCAGHGSGHPHGADGDHAG